MLNLQARTTVTPQFAKEQSFPINTGTLQIAEVPLHGIVRVQVGPESTQARAALEAALGTKMPLPERSTTNDETRLTWVGPNEWLVTCRQSDEAATLEALTSALDDLFATITLISDSRVSFAVGGRAAADFLAKGSAVDFDDSHFPVGAAVTTRFAGLPAMVLRKDASEYVLYFDVSMAGFMVDWLIDAAEEFDA